MGGKPSPEGPPQQPEGPILEPHPQPTGRMSIWDWQDLLTWPA